MKKILFLIVLCAFISFSTAALAGEITTEAGTTIGSVVFQPSPGTNFFAVSTEVIYDCASKHVGGDVVYTSSEDNPGIDATEPADTAKGKEVTDKTGTLST
jgi:hypothetical protein